MFSPAVCAVLRNNRLNGILSFKLVGRFSSRSSLVLSLPGRNASTTSGSRIQKTVQVNDNYFLLKYKVFCLELIYLALIQSIPSLDKIFVSNFIKLNERIIYEDRDP